ncbi:MAG: mechanosensitive ion channel family protein [Peptoanaerobacter stomatis]
MDTLEKAKDVIDENLDIFEIIFSNIKKAIPNIIIAILFFVIGYFIAKLLRKKIRTMMNIANMDVTLAGFLSQVLFFCVLIVISIASLSILGIPSSSFIAALGGFGIAVGLALQSNLSNFASGIIIIIFKPFKVGDYIETKDQISGTVRTISIMNTGLDTTDNKKIFIPNSSLTTNYVVNYSKNDIRNIILNIKISYDANHNRAIEILKSILENSKYTIQDADVICEISELSIYYVNILAKTSVKNNNYWDMYYSVMREIKDKFTSEKIEFAHFDTIYKA